jgi:hypothetical protein
VGRDRDRKSVQEVSKQNLAATRKTAIYDGAGSRIRTSNLLIRPRPYILAGVPKGGTSTQTEFSLERILAVASVTSLKPEAVVDK